METIKSRYTGAKHPGVGSGPPHVNSVARGYGYRLVSSESTRHEWHDGVGNQLVWSKKCRYTAYMLTYAAAGCVMQHARVGDLDQFLYRKQKLFA